MSENREYIVTLASRAAKQDKEALRELCEIKARHVLYLCIKLMRHKENGEDAAQEVFIQMQKSIGNLRDAVAFPLWLNRLIFSVCSNMRRSMKKQMLYVPLENENKPLYEINAEFLPVAFYENKEKRKILLDAFDKLSTRSRDVMLFYYYDEMTLEEIASIMDLHKSTISRIISKAQQDIKDHLEKQDFEIMLNGAAAGLGGAVLKKVLTAEAENTITNLQISKLMGNSGIRTWGYPAIVCFRKRVAPKLVLGLTSAALVGIGIFAYVTKSQPALPGFISPEYAISSPSSVSMPVSKPGKVKNRTKAEPASKQTSVANKEADTPSVPNATILPTSPGPSQDSAIFQPETVEPPAPDAVSSIVQSLSTPLSGSILFEDKTGNIQTDAVLPIEGYQMELRYQDQVLGTAEIDQNGHYTFEDSGILEPGSYTLHCLRPYVSQLDFVADNPDGSIQVTLIPGQATKAPHLIITDKLPPQIALSMTDKKGERTVVNPSRLDFLVADDTQAKLEWMIFREDSNTPIASGNQLNIASHLASLPTRNSPTQYTIKATATDLAANTSTKEFVFYLVSG